MAGISSGIYNALFRRNQTMLAAVFISAFTFEMTFHSTALRIWDGINRGRQWKDIKHRYVEHEDDE